METPESGGPQKELPEARKAPIDPPSFEPLTPNEPKKKEGKSWLSTLTTGLVVVLVIALGGVIAYLLSDLNSRHYRLSRSADMMVVEKGKFMPTGFQIYRPQEPGLSQIYQPVSIPAGADVPGGEVYEDRADLDRAMFAALAGWARQALEREGNGATLEAETLIERCDMLPGVSEEQRRDIQTLRADLAYRSGRRLLDGVVNQLKTAAEQFKRAINLGTSYAQEASTWLQEVQARITSLSDTPAPDSQVPEASEPEKAEASPPPAKDAPPPAPTPKARAGEPAAPPAPAPKGDEPQTDVRL